MQAAPLIRLVCWNEDDAKYRAEQITTLGYKVEAGSMRAASAFVTYFRTLNPAALVIDLDRMPSHGREVAILLRSSKSTRHIPIVFAGGIEEKVARIRAELPDAEFTAWKNIGRALKHAMEHPPLTPVHLSPQMQRWGDSSLTQKLGITAGMQVTLIAQEEDGFAEILGELPEGASLESRVQSGTRLVLYAVRTIPELTFNLDRAKKQLPQGASFWIVHPKQKPRQLREFNQNDVREFALARGFVDYKVCSINTDWSALKFTRRKP